MLDQSRQGVEDLNIGGLFSALKTSYALVEPIGQFGQTLQRLVAAQGFAQLIQQFVQLAVLPIGNNAQLHQGPAQSLVLVIGLTLKRVVGVQSIQVLFSPSIVVRCSEGHEKSRVC